MPVEDFNRLMNNARVKLPGALDAVLKMEFFGVLKYLFSYSNIWTEDIPFDVLPTDANRITNPDAFTYYVSPTTGMVVRLMGVVNGNGAGVRCIMPVPGEIVLLASPNEPTTYYARVALTVLDPVTPEGYPDFPETILMQYSNEILDGLLGRMMSQVAKPYSSKDGAVMHTKLFTAAVARIKAEAMRQGLYGAQAWRYPRTFVR